MNENLLTLDPPQYTKSRERCLNFITAQASIFHEAKLLDDNTFNNLRGYLRLTHIGTDSVYRILSEFSSMNGSFFDIIELHMPLQSWTWNYLKYSVRPYIAYQIQALHGLCQIVLERIPLALNKQIHLSAQNQNILFSSIALEFVEQCTEIIERLHHLSRQTENWTYTPERWDSAVLSQLQNKLARDLEFKQQSRMLVVPADQIRFFKEWALALRRFASISDIYNAEWGQSLTELPHALVKVMTVEYSSELHTFDEIKFADTGDLELFDLKHQELLQRLQRINHSLHTALLGMARGFAGITKVPSEQSLVLTQDTQRHLGRYLLSQGVEPGKAVAALDSLQCYQALHKVKASALIEPELAKINQVLSGPFADKLKEVERHDALSTQATGDKEHNFKLQTQLSERLQSLLPKILSLLLLALQLGSCGLKTLPKADIEDMRPEIPFRRTETPAKIEQDAGIKKTTPDGKPTPAAGAPIQPEGAKP